MKGWLFQVRLKGTISPTLLFRTGDWMIIDNGRRTKTGCNSIFFDSPHTSKLEFHKIGGISQSLQLITVVFINPRLRFFFPKKYVQIFFKFLSFTNSCQSKTNQTYQVHFVYFTPSIFSFITPQLFYSKGKLFYSKVGLCELDIYSLLNCSFPH